MGGPRRDPVGARLEDLDCPGLGIGALGFCTSARTRSPGTAVLDEHDVSVQARDPGAAERQRIDRQVEDIAARAGRVVAVALAVAWSMDAPREASGMAACFAESPGLLPARAPTPGRSRRGRPPDRRRARAGSAPRRRAGSRTSASSRCSVPTRGWSRIDASRPGSSRPCPRARPVNDELGIWRVDAHSHHRDHRRPHVRIPHAERRQHLSRGALGHGQEPEQDVLGAHEAVAQAARLLAGALKGRARRLVKCSLRSAVCRWPQPACGWRAVARSRAPCAAPPGRVLEAACTWAAVSSS